MEIISFSDHSILKQNMEYFAFHVRIALSDGMISTAESELLFLNRHNRTSYIRKP